MLKLVLIQTAYVRCHLFGLNCCLFFHIYIYVCCKIVGHFSILKTKQNLTTIKKVDQKTIHKIIGHVHHFMFAEHFGVANA